MQSQKNRKPTNWQNLQKNHNTRKTQPARQLAAVGGTTNKLTFPQLHHLLRNPPSKPLVIIVMVEAVAAARQR